MNSQVSTTSTEIKLLPLKFDLKRLDLKKMVRLLLQSLNQSTELQVWREFDQAKNYVWSAYDPVTKRSVYHISEDEMRAWIEHRNRLR